ncbi:hypothetical protein CXF80_06875 [Shewanella sp. Actino-trap-3]|uniref:FimV/HubP family polar landmark protein n=1 Tax=Shewanella sp. Actino-trap-3 TaxID=2058331 RepID=UPI000C34C97A|nr:FimV/HubP family polar landmark protein [Shewanella sp. Actino-trap-3]PKG78059.1 hypothetical protein CXF80_06875 [Shewanella sp. Actino-trap-3]
MTLRTSYIVGLIACTAVGLTSVQLIGSAQAETLKITGPNGEVKQQAKRQYGPTTSRDTFWSIAQKVRPSNNVSVYQVMAALFDANPHAFSGNNYNTLERGMILLVPSADVIAAIPNEVAKRRAEQDDRRVSKQTQPRTVINQPSAAKSLQIAKQTPAVTLQTKAITEANAVVVKDLNSTLDKANAKTLMLTDELARSQDELMISNNDNQVLKNKIEQMSLNIASLEEDLQLLRDKYEGLTLENKKLVDQTENIEPVVEEPADFWRSLMDNTILLILAASIPLIAIFCIIFWLLSRRNKKTQQAEIKTETQPGKESTTAIANDDSDDMVIHLDSNDEESIDDLLDSDSVDLQPEIQMSGDTEMDMASDMFISEKELEDEDGTSLDDLWAEAMEDQDSDLEPLEDDDDLNNLLVGLDTEGTAKDKTDDLDASAEDDIDSLLAEFDMPPESDDVAAAAVKTPETSADSTENSTEDDIDSLLAEFDMPAESDDVAAVVKTSETSADSTENSTEDDIDSLLAEFDMPAESDDVAADVNATETSADSTENSTEDDIDSLLAEFDMPAESDDVAAAVNVPETSAGSTEESTKDDIDSLLAEFDMPAESDDVTAAVNVPEASAGSTEDSTEDDIDSLLAEFDMPAESDDVTAAVKAPETSADSSGEDDVNEVGQNEEPIIDSAMAENSDELPIDEQENSESDDLAAQIAAELSDEDVADSTDDNETSDEDIDALLASLNEPVVESETYDHDNAAVQAQIAAELDDDTSSEALILDDDESLDDDINALLASFKEDTKAGDTPSTDTNSEQSISDKIDDTELFDEFDEYLSDVDLAKTDNADDVDADKDALSDVDTQADSKDQDNTLFDAQLEAALALTSRHDVKLEQGSTAASSPTPETEAEEALDALLAEMDDKDTSSSTAQNKTNKDSGFFNDLKSNKPKPELLDWESDLLKAAESAADEKEVDEPEVSDDDLLAAFSQSLKEDDNVDDYTSEDEYILSDDNLTVDEALAALDQKERSQSAEYKASNDDVTRFERENSYIDIDKLLNDADEDDDKTDQYKDVNVNMGSVNSLISNADMVDVDDEENSVNAKLDLARAYIEIEDQDSARALLKEVQMDGNERQQLEAKNLIKSFN